MWDEWSLSPVITRLWLSPRVSISRTSVLKVRCCSFAVCMDGNMMIYFYLYTYTKLPEVTFAVNRSWKWLSSKAVESDCACRRRGESGNSPGSRRSCPGGNGSDTQSSSPGRTSSLEAAAQVCMWAKTSCCLAPPLQGQKHPESQWRGCKKQLKTSLKFN